MSNYGPPPGSPQDPYGQQNNPYGQPQDPYAQQPYGAPPGYGAGNGNKGFWGSLFDYGFSSNGTTSIVKLFYVLATIILVLYLIFGIIAGFNYSAGAGIAVLIGGLIGIVLVLAWIRLTLELYLNVAKMREVLDARLPKG